MSFSKNLDFLLNVTNTPNNVLARHLSLDPSYISRLRRGERSAPHEDYIRMIAVFFSLRCMEPYILSALSTEMNNPYISTVMDPEELSDLLFTCLSETEETSSSRVQTILSDFSMPSSKTITHRQNTESETKKETASDLRMFYGMEGRRQATLALFSLALKQPQPGTLLLFSDENSKWMLDSSSFSREWSDLLWQIILRGNKVKVIHKVSRDIDEMLDVIHQWLPFYASGSVEPYYYPRLRDGVYKRTLSVLPGTAAVFATSIGDNTENTANFMSKDRLTVDSFTNEFYSYLALCRPLIHIHAPQNPASLLTDLYTFQLRSGSLIFETDALGLITMPVSMVKSLNQRCPQEIPVSYIESQKRFSSLFEQKLSEEPVYQIIRLSSAKNIREGKAVIGASLLGSGSDIFYTTEEYILHLQNILRLLTSYDHYHVVLSLSEENSYSLYCNEEQGVMVLKEGSPPILFEITEANMVSAFWDYMYQFLQNKQYHPQLRAATIQQICTLIDELTRTEDSK